MFTDSPVVKCSQYIVLPGVYYSSSVVTGSVEPEGATKKATSQNAARQ